MQYFKNLETQEELKAAYRSLAKEHHPDRGGSTEIMQQINAEYEEALKRILKGGGFTQEEEAEAFDIGMEHRELIAKICNLEGVIVEICGKWIWANGLTYPVKTELKAAGMFFSKTKTAWYWRPNDSKGGWSKGKFTMDEIRALHGSKKIVTAKKGRGAIAS